MSSQSLPAGDTGPLQGDFAQQTGPISGLAGIILCGGRSSRMGRPKCELPFGNETALQRMARIVGSVAERIIIVGSPEQRLPELPESARFVRDEEAYSGPLAGLIRGMSALPDVGDSAFVCGCDSPLLRPEVIRLLAAHREDAQKIVAVDDGERLQPLAASYPRAALATAVALFAAGERSLQALLRNFPLRRIPLEAVRQVDPDLDSLKNMNSELEYQDLLTQLPRRSGST